MIVTTMSLPIAPLPPYAPCPTMHHGAITLHSNAPHHPHPHPYTTPQSIHHHPYTTPVDHYTTWHPWPSIHHGPSPIHTPPIYTPFLHCNAPCSSCTTPLHPYTPHRLRLMISSMRACIISPHRSKNRHGKLKAALSLISTGDHWSILIVDQRTCSSWETTSALFHSLY
jgi:hypothetical protein